MEKQKTLLLTSSLEWEEILPKMVQSAAWQLRQLGRFDICPDSVVSEVYLQTLEGNTISVNQPEPTEVPAMALLRSKAKGKARNWAQSRPESQLLNGYEEWAALNESHPNFVTWTKKRPGKPRNMKDTFIEFETDQPHHTPLMFLEKVGVTCAQENINGKQVAARVDAPADEDAMRLKLANGLSPRELSDLSVIEAGIKLDCRKRQYRLRLKVKEILSA